MHIHALGDRAFLIEVEGGIDAETLERVRTMMARIEESRPAGVTDVVPAYASVTVHYEPLLSDAATMRAALEAVVQSPGPARPVPQPHTREIPVLYGGVNGPDLEDVAARCGLSPEEAIAIHSGATYTVHMIGFVPGFPYLGGLDTRLATPRRPTPRTLVPAGSVGIGGAQTGVYPIASPGGWHLIGRTPVRLFDASRDSPAWLRLGDRVRFIACSDR